MFVFLDKIFYNNCCNVLIVFFLKVRVLKIVIKCCNIFGLLYEY